MRPAFVLLIDLQGLHAWQRHGQELHNVGHFLSNATGEQDFTDFLAQHASAPFIVVINLPGERYLIEASPRLRGQERQRLQADRLQRTFPNSRWRCARWLTDSAAEGDQLLLMVIEAAPEITRWINLLHASRSALLAIYNLAQCGRGLQRQHAPEQEGILLLSRHGNTLRLSWLAKGGQLIASTLQAMPDADEISTQCQRFLQQLPNNHYAHPIHILALGVDAPTDNAWGEWQRVDTGEDATPHCLNALLRHQPKEQFGNSTDCQQGQRYRLAHRLDLASWSIAFLALVACCALLLDWQAQRGALAEAVAQQKQRAQQRATANAELAALPLTANALLDLLKGHARLTMAQSDIRDALQKLSKALDDCPEIRLEALSWDNQTDEVAAAPGLRLHIEAQFPDSPTAQMQAEFQRLTRQLSAVGELEIIRNPWQNTAPGRFILRLRLRSTT